MMKEKLLLSKMANFSQVYGTKREEVLSMLDRDSARKLTVQFIHNFPKTVYLAGLRKLKSRHMHQAMSTPGGLYENGNHKIVYLNHTFTFFYRGTAIYLWNMFEDTETMIPGEFDHTASTMNQRREIRKAIEEFREAVLKL